ncbi:MAG: hypothetical protein KGJ13_12640 [Patescibacteria group bacterium]|nr:hypothetical protein [Patescibacteria group bacterium]
MPAPQQAVDQQDIWKDKEMRAFAIALISHALARLNAGEQNFTTDCVPENERIVDGHPVGPGIAGSVLTKLQHANLVRPIGVVSYGIFYQRREKSSRPSAKTRYLNVYQLTSRASAMEFLHRHCVEVSPGQLDFQTI